MKIYLCALSLTLLLTPAVIAQQVYETTDEQGNTEFTDSPPTEEAKPVDLETPNIADSVEVRPHESAPAPRNTCEFEPDPENEEMAARQHPNRRVRWTYQRVCNFFGNSNDDARSSNHEPHRPGDRRTDASGATPEARAHRISASPRTSTEAAAAAETKRPRQAATGRGRGAATPSDIKLLCRSRLALWQRLRLLQSGVLSVITVASTYLPAINCADEGKPYHARTKGVSGHGLGPPHPHVLVR